MLWSVHIYDPNTKETRTEHLEVPNTRSIADVRVVYIAAEKKFKSPMKYMLALPAKE